MDELTSLHLTHHLENNNSSTLRRRIPWKAESHCSSLNDQNKKIIEIKLANLERKIANHQKFLSKWELKRSFLKYFFTTQSIFIRSVVNSGIVLSCHKLYYENSEFIATNPPSLGQDYEILNTKISNLKTKITIWEYKYESLKKKEFQEFCLSQNYAHLSEHLKRITFYQYVNYFIRAE